MGFFSTYQHNVSLKQESVNGRWTPFYSAVVQYMGSDRATVFLLSGGGGKHSHKTDQRQTTVVEGCNRQLIAFPSLSKEPGREPSRRNKRALDRLDKRILAGSQVDDDDDGDACPICVEMHRSS